MNLKSEMLYPISASKCNRGVISTYPNYGLALSESSVHGAKTNLQVYISLKREGSFHRTTVFCSLGICFWIGRLRSFPTAHQRGYAIGFLQLAHYDVVGNNLKGWTCRLRSEIVSTEAWESEVVKPSHVVVLYFVAARRATWNQHHILHHELSRYRDWLFSSSSSE